MTKFKQDMLRCQLVLVLRAVLDAGGNMCAAARETGLHRNTVWRVVRSAGYTAPQLRRMAKAHARKKPPVSVAVIEMADRRTA